MKKNETDSKARADHWVSIAKEFGEKCMKVQKDQSLSIDQKLEKQKILSEEIINQIKNDSDLKEDEKSQMTRSIETYIKEWSSLNEAIHKVEGSA